MSDNWLEELSQLRAADKAKYQAPTQYPASNSLNERKTAIELLRQSKAHQLMRQVQKALLAGQGALDIFDRAGDYERVITLVWQGPISAARRPKPDDPEDYRYILVGVRQGKVWVNGKKISSPTPEALKAALLKACKNPKREKRT